MGNQLSRPVREKPRESSLVELPVGREKSLRKGFRRSLARARECVSAQSDADARDGSDNDAAFSDDASSDDGDLQSTRLDEDGATDPKDSLIIKFSKLQTSDTDTSSGPVTSNQFLKTRYLNGFVDLSCLFSGLMLSAISAPPAPGFLYQTSEPPTTFHAFNVLSPELRLLIWKAARPDPRIVRLERRRSAPFVYSATPIPGILHACHDSRTYALKYWFKNHITNVAQPHHSNTSMPACFYALGYITFFFNPAYDFAFRGCRSCEGIYASSCLPCRSTWAGVALRIERLFMRPNVIDNVNDPFVLLLLNDTIRFPNAREVVLLSPSTQKLRFKLKLQDMTPSTERFAWQTAPILDQFASAFRDYHPDNDLDDIPHRKIITVEYKVNAELTKKHGFFEDFFNGMDLQHLSPPPYSDSSIMERKSGLFVRFRKRRIQHRALKYRSLNKRNEFHHQRAIGNPYPKYHQCSLTYYPLNMWVNFKLVGGSAQ